MAQSVLIKDTTREEREEIVRRGLSNIVTDQELLYEAIHGGEPSDCCQRLLHITLSRGAPDNVTAVLFQIV